jgi:penicillin-binding protein 2
MRKKIALYSSSQDARKLFTRRAFVVGGVKSTLAALLIGRLGYLGFIRSSHYQTLADGNRIKLQILLPPRGLIIDRSGVEIANNKLTYFLTLTPDQVSNLEAILIKLNELIDLEGDCIEALLAEIKKTPKFKPFILKSNLTWEEVCKVQVNQPELEGVTLERGYKRYYPYAYEFAHLVGFVRAPSDQDDILEELANLPDYQIGKTGMERQYETLLQGKIGYREIEVNAHRRIVRHLKKIESVPGSTLHLSLDTKLQTIVSQRMSQEKSGSVVVIDVKTGEILSCVSTPAFDSNLFVNGISYKDWDSLNNSLYTPLNNKAIQGLYPPGSIFKLVVALAALETGKISPTQERFCKGFIEVGTHRFHCVRREGHGHVNMVKALQVSCDSYFYEIGSLLGINLISEMAIGLGLGEKTGIELPNEKKGLIPTRPWKKISLGQSWTVGDTINTSIGQGAMLCTPLQMTVLIARLITGKEVIPTLLYSSNKDSANFDVLNAKPNHLEILRKGMEACVNEPEGTAYASRIEDTLCRMAGKTATSQVRRITKAERETRVLKNEEIEWKRRDHSIFAGYAPLHAPRYAICVLIEHGGGGGRVATPIARDILAAIQKERRFC